MRQQNQRGDKVDKEVWTRLEAELSSTSGTQSQPRHRNVNPTSTRDASTENHLSDDDFWQVSPAFRLPAGFLSLGIHVGSHLHAEQLPKAMKRHHMKDSELPDVTVPCKSGKCPA